MALTTLAIVSIFYLIVFICIGLKFVDYITEIQTLRTDIRRELYEISECIRKYVEDH